MSFTAFNTHLQSYGDGLNAAVIGASGGLGRAIAARLACSGATNTVLRLSRSAPEDIGSEQLRIDLEDEDSIESAAEAVAKAVDHLHLVIVATGVLHNRANLQPEKTWRALSGMNMETAFRINATGPALIAKYFLPLLAENRKTAFGAISARVGSISDNQLGGWYAYRASKAALNMLLKTLSIELAQSRPMALCIGLHPGTVDTPLSAPFQRSLPDGKLFCPETSATHLLKVLDNLTPKDSGGHYAWDGSRIPF